jgi:Zn-dependent protease with chaperone function
MLNLRAQWFDGQCPLPRPVLLTFLAGETSELLLQTEEGEQRRLPLERIHWPERSRQGQRQMLLPDGGVLAPDSTADYDAWAAAIGRRQSLAARWAQSWSWSLFALVLLIASIVAATRWGIPATARELAAWVPQSFSERMGKVLMQDISQRGWLKPSELPAAQQAQIRAGAQLLLQAGYRGEAPPVRLHVHKAPGWLGPNAFALPSGDIVITDALVRLLQDGSAQDAMDPALLGVIAHEIGHVQHRHGLRLVMEAGALSALMGFWIGDYSALLAGAPTLFLQASYSRSHEREADAEALRLMRAAGIDPRAMVRFFAKLKEAMPKRDGDAPSLGLSTHPTDSERVRFFEQGR